MAEISPNAQAESIIVCPAKGHEQMRLARNIVNRFACFWQKAVKDKIHMI